jgi:hypothetical protein
MEATHRARRFTLLTVGPTYPTFRISRVEYPHNFPDVLGSVARGFGVDEPLGFVLPRLHEFLGFLITLAHVQDILLAQVNRTALILALELLFVRVQIFGSGLGFAKFCQKEWPSENVDRVVAGIVRKRGLN